MSLKPSRDPHEDLELFKLRLAEWEETEKLRRTADGGWVPVKVFVTWREADVDPEAFEEYME